MELSSLALRKSRHPKGFYPQDIIFAGLTPGSENVPNPSKKIPLCPSENDKKHANKSIFLRIFLLRSKAYAAILYISAREQRADKTESKNERYYQMAKNATAQKATEATVTEAPVNPITEAHKLDDLMTQYKTKSAVIRFLTAEGHTRSNIAKFMNIRYQHVRNVQVADAEKAES